MCDSLPSQLPTVTLNNIEIKRENSIITDENLTWKNHIEVVENEISKNIGVLYRARHLLHFKNLLKFFFPSFTFTSVMLILLGLVQGILKKPKHAAQIVFHASRLGHSRPLLKDMKALNVY